VCEISNQQYTRFDARHNSGFIDQQGKDHNTPGYPANEPQQPVIRVSWQQAMEFCRWLTQRTGERFALPTEAEWEWACRAGSDTPLWFGQMASDFAPFANLGDRMLMNFAVRGVNPKPIAELTYLSFLPRADAVVDGQMIAGPVGAYQPNPWGLMDMHGNVAEWTRTAYRPYPYDVHDGRDDPSASGQKAVRGGSWRDRPERARSAFRLSYDPYQRVFTVGFRVVCPVATN
jgi:formylglycine-generating enzyme required for sulfatase activity